MTDQGPFPQDALEANRAGQLTPAQRKGFRGQSRGFRKAELQFAVIATIIGLLVWFAPGPAKYAMVKPLIGIGCLILAGFLVVRSFLGADSLTQDLRDGRVESVEGAITKTSVTADSRGSSSTSYFFHVGGIKVKVWRGAYQAAPEAGFVKIYYLPHSHELVNLERVADTALPADAMKSPQVIEELAKDAFHSHDPIQAAEARAHLATMGEAFNAAITSAGPPPSSDRDSRPLAQAIVGDWSNAFMDVSFAADGTLSASMPGAPGARPRSGHWSVDSSGHLVSDVMGGGPMPTEAWVSGDQLTVFVGENGVTFQRVAT
ncbi:MAG TPA: hypothetical protein VF383_03820 [Candidatus Dormibacteraeota bacterium]